MDLALHLGTSVESLRRNMTEQEFLWWADYRRKHWLPLQRIEWYLARLTHMIAATMGGAKDVETSDFLLNLEPKSVDEVVDEIEQSWPHP
jgi:hypothetical protein